MYNHITFQGQSLSSADIGQIRELIRSHPDWNRTRLSRELCRLWDWQKKYGHEVVLLETFVEKNRFRGTCYKAANWIYVGEIAGRTRNDVRHDISAQVKAVYVYPLRRDFRRVLTQKNKE